MEWSISFREIYIAAPPPLGSMSGGYNTAGCGGLRARALLPGRLLPTGRRFFLCFRSFASLRMTGGWWQDQSVALPFVSDSLLRSG